METITVSQTSFSKGLQKSTLNITDQHFHLPISNNTVSKPYNKENTFASPYLANSQPITGRHINIQNQTKDDNEISIFDAQKYFNEGNEQFPKKNIKHSSLNATDQYDLTELPRLSSVSSSTDTYSARNYRGKSFHATPTASSEASWNSQTGLLSIPPGTIKVSINPVVDNKKLHTPRWSFRRNCLCIGKKSLQVDTKTISSEARSPIHSQSVTPTPTINTIQTEKITSTKENNTFVNKANQPAIRVSLTAGRNYNDGTGFSFPILKPSTTSPTLTRSINTVEDPPRDSLDVFQPPYKEISGTKRMTMMTSSNFIDDDAASDGSSDLFEIESFSTQTTTTTYQMYNNSNLRRDSLDEASTFRNPRLSLITTTGNNYRRNSLEEPATPSVAPTEGYEPSEASIDWSVTTAEGFDRASVTTCEDMMMTMAAVERDGGGSGGDGRRNIGGSKGNGLLGLGCRSEKAVMVGPGPRRVGPGLAAQHVDGSWMYNKPPLAGRTNQIHRG